MKVFNTIFEKIIWFIVLVLFFGGISIFALMTFLAPPRVRTEQLTKQPIASKTSPVASPVLTQNPSPIVAPTAVSIPTATATPEASKIPKDSNTDTSTSNGNSTTNSTNNADGTTNTSTQDASPAIASPEQVVIVVPRRLRPGAVLSKYENIDGNYRPDPINYTPISKKAVAGLTLTDVDKSQFQQVSGYFLVEKTGAYNFLISYSQNLLLLDSDLSLKIDGQPLDNPKGGNVTLERGWHQVDLFYKQGFGNNPGIQVKWGKVGGDLKLLKTWRES